MLMQHELCPRPAEVIVGNENIATHDAAVLKRSCHSTNLSRCSERGRPEDLQGSERFAAVFVRLVASEQLRDFC